ncbi:YraN family protein [Roseivivax sp. THAF40]|nr:YraN family protein [Roseivivax sp. THAF40]
MINPDLGKMAYLGGLSAESGVAADYERRGYAIARTRWRGKSGEVDLILRDGEALIFVEVKKSRSFSRAAERVSPRQMTRLCAAAEEFLAGEPRGALTEMRFDVALQNAHGEIRIIENAFAA